MKDKTTLRELDGKWVEIATPYLDRHNDALQIYARQENGGFLLSGSRSLHFIYKWTDTREIRSPNSKAYAVLNDTEQPISSGVLDGLQNYGIHPVLWNSRAEVVAELAA